MSTPIKRLEEEGSISTEGWEDLNEHEKLCFPGFVEAIENTWEGDPPSMQVNSTDGGDISLVFGLGLSESEFGPAWEFSLKNALQNCLEWPEEDVKLLAKALRSLTEFVESSTE